MLKKILIGLAVVLAVFVGVVSTQPDTFTVERTGTVPGTPDVAFALVNDFHHWEQWSPWGKLDPSQKTTFDGAPMGTGAIYTWSGNDDVGEGRMTIEESRPNELVRIKLEFIKPMATTNTTTFTFKPEAGGSKVTWSMQGTNNFISKAFCLFMDMDKMVGKDFEKGLAAMSTAAEAEVKKRAEAEAAAKLAAEKLAAEQAAAAPAEGQPAPAVAAPTP